MAPPSARKRAREANFLELGVAGRRTGVTLKDTGIRDEHGLEPIDGIFSSPAKSPEKSPARGPPKRNGAAAHNSTITTEEEMEVAESTMPDVTEALTGRRLKHSARTALPPPRARSPIKTFLNSPARRGSSLGPISSPLRRLNEGQAGAAAVSRRLDFSTIEQSPFLARPPQKARMVTELGSSLFGDNVGGKRATGKAEASSNSRTRGWIEESEQSSRQQAQQQRQDDYYEDEDDFQPVQMDDDYDDQPQQEEELEQHRHYREPSPESPPQRRPGRQPKKAPAPKKGARRTSNQDPAKAAPAPRATAVATKKGRGRAPKNPQLEVFKDSPKRRRRGQEELEEEEDDYEEEYQDERPAKRRRDESIEPPPPARQRQKAKKPPPSQRDPNARISSGRASKDTSREDTPEPKKPSRSRKETKNPALKPRSLYITRRETPLDDGASRTRSGRTSVRPLAYWRNERIVYGESRGGPGEGHPLPTIKEIIRTEEVEPPKPKRGRKTTARKQKVQESESEEEDEDDMEEWERDPGILHAEVYDWDNELGRADDRAPPVETDIAFAASAIETVPVANSTFRYAKIISMPFYGAGMVDLPPRGQKRMKNSSKMHMSFFVHRGRVLVDVAGTQFRVGKGGMWQVPRGNFYSITNESPTQLAKIFFSQGCEVPVGDI